METDLGEQIVRWTARLAVAAYVCRLTADVWTGRLTSRATVEADRSAENESAGPAPTTSRGGSPVLEIWTVGCVIYLLHVAAAFHFVHGWSHAAAWRQTAQQTADLTGWNWGGGLWINYAFTLWWPLDVAWSWRRGLDRMPRWYVRTLHAACGFLMINATVVFGPAGWQWTAGLLVGVAILVSAARRWGRRRFT
jgi:hypothetical protein